LQVLGVGHGGFLAVALLLLLHFQNLFVQAFNCQISFTDLFLIVQNFFFPLQQFLIVLPELCLEFEQFLLEVGSFAVEGFDLFFVLVVELFSIENFA
jgi:hypothetical protein